MRIPTRIRQFLQTNYQLTKARWAFHFLLSGWHTRQVIVVYQMGKVGSSSIVASLEALNLDVPVYHIHTLTSTGIARRDQIYREMCRNSKTTYLPRAKHLLVSQHLRKALDRDKDKNWKFITLVRDPIAVNLSGFFQTIDYYLPDFTERYRAGDVTIDTAIELFLKQHSHEWPVGWLDVEIKPALGIDVYAQPFSGPNGYQIFQNEKVQLLLIKLEKLDDCIQAAFNEFLGLEQISLVKANVGSKKKYAEAYEEFKEAITLPAAYIDKMYSSRYAQHFYSQDEIAALRSKWGNN